jgi:cyclomaltodextrinase
MDPYDNRDVSKGIDGWRLDVADCIAHPFWKDWRVKVKSINP